MVGCQTTRQTSIQSAQAEKVVAPTLEFQVIYLPGKIYKTEDTVRNLMEIVQFNPLASTTFDIESIRSVETETGVEYDDTFRISTRLTDEKTRGAVNGQIIEDMSDFKLRVQGATFSGQVLADNSVKIKRVEDLFEMPAVEKAAIEITQQALSYPLITEMLHLKVGDSFTKIFDFQFSPPNATFSIPMEINEHYRLIHFDDSLAVFETSGSFSLNHTQVQFKATLSGTAEYDVNNKYFIRSQQRLLAEAFYFYEGEDFELQHEMDLISQTEISGRKPVIEFSLE